jgi:hypothetical protein
MGFAYKQLAGVNRGDHHFRDAPLCDIGEDLHLNFEAAYRLIFAPLRGAPAKSF